ncbi:MAG: hypothetical protein KBG21_10515, partial [Ignavibacteria bacterium]|nr:hypothetical protein [Ignavibacteria bacterium]
KEDNPVIPPVDTNYRFDSSRFQLKEFNLNYPDGFWTGAWVIDTNEFFVVNAMSNFLIHYKNGVYENITFSDGSRMSHIGGFSKNEGYLFSSVYTNGTSYPNIKKWNGSSFVTIPNSQTFPKGFRISTAYYKSPTEIWLACIGQIIKFDGSKLTSYPVEDSLMLSMDIFYDSQNRLRLWSYYFNKEIDTVFRNYIYEFRGNQFEKIYEFRTNLYLDETILAVPGNFFGGYSRNKIYEFQEGVFIPRIQTQFSAFNNMIGNSFDDLFIKGNYINHETHYLYSFFHWNGSRWSLEKGPPNDYLKFGKVNENLFYAVNSDFSAYKSYLLIYKRK